jgi:outer membrane protein
MNRIMKLLFQSLAIIFILNLSIYAQRILTLEESISIALKESYNIKTAEYSLISSQKYLEAARMGLRTSVNMELDLPRYSRTLSSQFNPNSGAEEFFELGYTTFESRLRFNQPIIYTNGTFSVVGSIWQRDQFHQLRDIPTDYYTNLSLRLYQPLFTFNNQRAGMMRAEINLLKSERNYTRAEKDIVYEITASFYRLYQAKKNVEIVSEKVNQTEISYNTALNKFKAGLIAEVEALQLEVDLAASKNELLSAKRNFSEARDDFKLLIGLPLEEEIDVTAELEYKPVIVDLSLAIEFALENRTELKNAEADIELSRLNVDEVDSKGNISALLSANYGINRNDNEFRDLFHQFAQDRSVALTLQLPLIDWGRNSREVESAEAVLNQNILSYENQRLQIRKEIMQITNKIESAKARVEVLSKSVEVAQKSYDITLIRFQAGNITSFDLSQMQLRLTDAKINSLNALIDYKLAIADLSRRTMKDFGL